jgi:hypothetical protein
MAWSAFEIVHGNRRYTVGTDGTHFRIRSAGILPISVPIIKDRHYVGPIEVASDDTPKIQVVRADLIRLIRED